jgi:O-antigen ligase
LWWDLVQEQATWFSERGDPGFRQWVEVGAGGGARGRASSNAGPSTAFAMPTREETVSRGKLWRAALAAWARRPLFGLGPDNFRHHYGEYLGLHAADERLHANSLYFETLASLGAAGLLVLAGVMAALARATRRAAARAETRTLALGLGAGLLAVALHGILDYGLEFTPTYGLTWLLAGSVVGLARGPEEPPP